MIPGAGRLAVHAAVTGGRVALRLEAPAPLPFGRLVRGKRPAEAARLAALLFNVCAAAQEGGARAALGLPQDPAAAEKLRAETSREHALKLAVELPQILGHAPDPAAPAAMARGGDAARRALFGPSGAPRDVEALALWAGWGETAAARAMGALLQWPEAWGRGGAAPLDPSAPVDWPGAGAPAGQGGRPVEASVLTRQAEAPLVRELLALRGPCPATRFAARLVEADALLSGHAPAIRAPGPAPQAAAPHAAAEAARGTMLMRAALGDDGRVAAFSRATPTDFALAPGGALEAALSAIPTDPAAPQEAVARAALALIDPCLPWTLSLSGALSGTLAPEPAHA
ncbi:hypothetical protein ACQ5SO_16290 [Rhodovulum sp. DZ06]|uniref:hypothetical protein n=1 Tax=Rhodovulum sp. DZ06 TaxID=3425126 RepID=UPI003D328C0E